MRTMLDCFEHLVFRKNERSPIVAYIFRVFNNKSAIRSLSGRLEYSDRHRILFTKLDDKTIFHNGNTTGPYAAIQLSRSSLRIRKINYTVGRKQLFNINNRRQFKKAKYKINP